MGGINPINNQPTDFLCLLVKLIQLNPSEQIINEYLSDPDFKYLRALSLIYIRFTYSSKKVYEILEEYYSDYKKLIILNSKGEFEIIHMDELIEILLNKDLIFEISLPKLINRHNLEKSGAIKEYKSKIENELNEDDIFENIVLPKNFFKLNKNKEKKKEEEKEESNIVDISKLDPNSNEYWLELRKKIGIK